MATVTAKQVSRAKLRGVLSGAGEGGRPPRSSALTEPTTGRGGRYLNTKSSLASIGYKLSGRVRYNTCAAGMHGRLHQGSHAGTRQGQANLPLRWFET